MKSYQQYCSVARALDVVGDRWVLLIVRELLALGPSRYSDLKRGLPGIATNLLAERLRTMEAEGLLERYEAPAPVGATLYQLTERGAELQDVVHALARWGLGRMLDGPEVGDAVQPQWTALFAGLELAPQVAPGAEVVVGVEAGDEAVHAVLWHGAFEIRRGAARCADVTLSGEPQLVGAVLSGLLSPDQATAFGLAITGTPSVLTELLHVTAGPPARSGDTS
ncbi:helix-turn-helix domain-containing protein [Streptacidiphilus sp. N1-10]|uniref:Helix-turn-helix domain-containing protein n=1 Tax=Streptacidiphilus jeojiensis TaxID=3229225 RepID=A0ABV6XTR4_9ACTN